MNNIFHNVLKGARCMVLAALAFAFAGTSGAFAQTTKSQTFTVCPLNVDGLPESILGVTVNSDGPGAEGTTKIGQYLAGKGIDILGFSEDFTYNDELVAGLGSAYTTTKFRGGIGTSNLSGTKFLTDGLLFGLKNDHQLVYETIASWNKTHGNLTAGFDENIDKGYRCALVTLSSGLQVEVYIMHMDAETSAEDNAARASQWSQLAQAVVNGNSKLPKIVMGDTNSRYTRDDIINLFYSPLQSAGYTVNDVWVDKCQDGVVPTYNTESLMVNDKTNPEDYKTGEIVDKVLFVNPANPSYKLTANSITFDASNYLKEDGSLLGDHCPVIVEFTIEGPDYSANSQSNFWEGESFTVGTNDQRYLYNVGTGYFLTYDNETTATITDINKATYWNLNYDSSKKGTSLMYQTESGDQYRVKIANNTYKVQKASSRAVNFEVSNSDVKTSGAYWFKADINLATTNRYFGITGNTYGHKKTYDNTSDWFLITETQKQAYIEYADLYDYLADNVNSVADLSDEVVELLNNTSNTTYSTSADAISKLKTMKERQQGIMSGIESATVVATGEPKISAIYGVSGEQRSAMQRGINVVKMTDGSVKKIFVK